MCSIFVANCFIKHVTSTEGTISGTALYRNDNVFREISFKGYYDKVNNVLNFSKHSIVVLVGRYARTMIFGFKQKAAGIAEVCIKSRNVKNYV